jgi:hypothetical protein
LTILGRTLDIELTFDDVQECPALTQFRINTWPNETPVSQNLLGTMEDIEKTAIFLSNLGLRTPLRNAERDIKLGMHNTRALFSQYETKMEN